MREKVAAGDLEAVRIGSGPKAPIRVDAAELERWIFGPPAAVGSRGAASIAGSSRGALEDGAA